MNSALLNPDACIACTSCVVQCPVAKATPNFLGPRMVGPAHERFRLLGLSEEPSLHYCANCKNCDIACPQGVPISTFNMMGRAAQAKKQRPPLRDWVLGHGETMARGLGFIPAALRNFGMLNPITRQILGLLGVSEKAPLPPFARRTFRQALKKRATPPTQGGEKVVFFPGCYVVIYDPQTGMDIVWLLEKAGYDVLVPEDFRCCGLPMVANGFWEDARKNAARNVALLRTFKAQGVPVLTACPSCSLMFSHDIPLYFPEITGSNDITAQQGFDTSLVDTQTFLLDAIQRGRLDMTHASPLGQVLYHSPCHMRAQGVGLPAVELLRCVPQTHVRNADAGCCGISGSYGFKKEKYPIAMQVGAELFAAIRKSAADIVASECGTCRVQMRHGAQMDSQKRPCLHPVSALARALRR